MQRGIFDRNNPKASISAYFTEKILRNALGKQIPSSTPIVDVRNVFVEPQDSYKILDKAERGELIYAEIATNSTLVIPEIILYNEREEPVTVINNRTFQELLSLGRGLTPGGVQPTSTGQTQDERGTFIPNMFHVGRYKDDQLSDWIDTANENENPDRYIVGRFVATIPFPYSIVTFYLKNTTTDTAKKIYSASICRTVYESNEEKEKIDVNVENIKSIEVFGDELDVEPEEMPIVEQHNVAEREETNVDYTSGP
jgi:hypothetical protein